MRSQHKYAETIKVKITLILYKVLKNFQTRSFYPFFLCGMSADMGRMH